jgi:hydrogenase expression/formation protein HypE
MNNDLILLGHGSGGRLSHQLLDELIIPALSCGGPADQNDAALLDSPSGRLAFTTDSYVVDPVFFPGGNIGDLAVNGTVNDLAMMGAKPLWMSVGLILEEGFSKKELAQILASMKRAADIAGVRIVTGDTKVVPRGKADRIFINTSGIGILEHDVEINGAQALPGDSIIVSGTIGDHGVAVMASREGLELDTAIESDSAALNTLASELVSKLGGALHVLRDPTRGGVSTTLKEIALQSGADLLLREDSLPVKTAVRGLCSVLGLDPLYVANEGKMLIFVSPESAERAMGILQRNPLGIDAALIGEVTGKGTGRISLETRSGGVRIIEMLSGEQLPRIC